MLVHQDVGGGGPLRGLNGADVSEGNGETGSRRVEKLKTAKIVNSRMKDHYWDDADRNRKQNRKESSSPSSSPLVSL